MGCVVKGLVCSRVLVCEVLNVTIQRVQLLEDVLMYNLVAKMVVIG